MKRTIAAKTDIMSRLVSGRFKNVEWTIMYILVRWRAMATTIVKIGRRVKGLALMSPIEVLSKVHRPVMGYTRGGNANEVLRAS